MQLPDFDQFEPLLELRRQMDAKKLGHFELFDPALHLTGEERSRLENQGMATTLGQLRALPDMTLAVKNGRVVVFEQQHEKGKKQHFHVALCPRLEALAESSPQQSPQPSLIATTCLHSPFPVLNHQKRRSLSVCPDCLALLGYKGFSLTRNRRIRYSEQLLRYFELTDFFKVYTLYPIRNLNLSVKKELLREPVVEPANGRRRRRMSDS